MEKKLEKLTETHDGKIRYFVFNKDYKIKYPKFNKEYEIIIPKGQPILIDRVLRECGYLYLFRHLDGEISLSLGVIKNDITTEEEIKMWQILFIYIENCYFNLLDTHSNQENNHWKEKRKIWREMEKNDEIISKLKGAMKIILNNPI